MSSAAFAIIEAGVDVGAVEFVGEGAEELTAHASAYIDALQEQSDRALTADGIDPQAFYAWAWSNHPQALKAAMFTHSQTQALDAYAPILAAYRDTSRQPEGDRLVTIGGQTMSSKVARRIGLL